MFENVLRDPNFWTIVSQISFWVLILASALTVVSLVKRGREGTFPIGQHDQPSAQELPSLPKHSEEPEAFDFSLEPETFSSDEEPEELAETPAAELEPKPEPKLSFNIVTTQDWRPTPKASAEMNPFEGTGIPLEMRIVLPAETLRDLIEIIIKQSELKQTRIGRERSIGSS